MRFNFKKVSALATSALMAGMTVGMAAAANYPAPFIQSGASDVAIVVGSGAGVSILDSVSSARTLDNDLRSRIAPSSSDSSATVTGGGAASLSSGSDYLYLGDDLGENVDTLTKDDLPAVLADGTFTDDDGTDTDYEQIITIGKIATNNFAFSNSGNDLDNPALILELDDDPAVAPIYNLTATFDSAVAFNATASEGEELVLFGKTYTVGTATDADTLVLLGGSDSATVNVGETITLTVDGETYEVTLTGISDAASNAQASLTINGDSKTFSQGNTKTLAGVDVYVKTIFRTGDNIGYVELQLGANKLTLESGKKVKYGSDDTNIDGTLVTITGGVNAMTKLEIAIAATDNDADHVLLGESFMDPVFGSVKVKFTSVNNGPSFTDESDTSTARKMIDIVKGGNRELQVTVTDTSGTTKTLPFTYQGALSDDNSKSVEVVEGATLVEDEYFTLVSGNYQHFMQVDDITISATDANDEVAITDLFTGTTYTEDDTNLSATTGSVIISGQTYTIERVSDTSVKIYSSDYSLTSGSGTVDVFPYLELVSGKDHRVAFTDDVTLTNVANGTTISLPTGTIVVNTPASITASTGAVYYNYTLLEHAADGASNITIALDKFQNATAFAETDPALLFVEEEDKSEATADTKNGIVIPTTDSGSYSQVTTPVFAGSTYDSEGWDDSDFTGYVTAFGTYIKYDSSDTNQDFATITFPDSQMYATVHIAEESANIESSGGTTTSAYDGQVYLDTETSQYDDKNVIVVGGSCINSAAAALVGGSFCGDAWKEATGAGPGEYVIKGYADSTITGKMALLVAGWEAADTVNAATYLKNNAVDTSGSYKGTTSTSATAVTETA